MQLYETPSVLTFRENYVTISLYKILLTVGDLAIHVDHVFILKIKTCPELELSREHTPHALHDFAF